MSRRGAAPLLPRQEAVRFVARLGAGPLVADAHAARTAEDKDAGDRSFRKSTFCCALTAPDSAPCGSPSPQATSFRHSATSRRFRGWLNCLQARFIRSGMAALGAGVLFCVVAQQEPAQSSPRTMSGRPTQIGLVDGVHRSTVTSLEAAVRRWVEAEPAHRHIASSTSPNGPTACSRARCFSSPPRFRQMSKSVRKARRIIWYGASSPDQETCPCVWPV